MCRQTKILAKVKRGELSFCRGCKSFHLVFNNLFFALTGKELKRLKFYIDQLEIDYWEDKYAHSDLTRKIPLPTNQENLMIMFNKQEIVELRTLLSFIEKSNQNKLLYLSVDDIDYALELN